MQIRKFNIPSFEDWNNNMEYKESIGDYTCKIAVVGYGCNGNTTNEFTTCIANYNNPTNIGVPKVFSSELECERNDFEKIKNWYNDVKEEANKVWEKYIIGTYFE